MRLLTPQLYDYILTIIRKEETRVESLTNEGKTINNAQNYSDYIEALNKLGNLIVWCLDKSVASPMIGIRMKTLNELYKTLK